MSGQPPLAPTPDAPGIGLVVVTPTDTTPLTGGPCRGLWVGAAGNISVTLANDAPGVGGTVIPNVPAGTLLPLAVKILWSTGTTGQSAGTTVAVY